VVGRLKFQLPEIIGRCVDAFVVWTDEVVHLLDVRSESCIELLKGPCFDILKLRQYPLLPFLLSNLLCLSNSVRAVFGVIGTCICISWVVDLGLDAVVVRLNLFDVRGKVLVVVRLNMWF